MVAIFCMNPEQTANVLLKRFLLSTATIRNLDFLTARFWYAADLRLSYAALNYTRRAVSALLE